LKVTQTPLDGVKLIEPTVFGDARGFFLETYSRERYRAAGITEELLQDNLSRSGHGVLRGLHFQNPAPQGKLVYVLEGEVFDVAVDIRRSSPTFGKWYGVTLSGGNKKQLWLPPGFAHGFCVTSETALFAYKCSAYYTPASEHTIRYDDPDIGIDWAVTDPLLSDKDRNAPGLREMDSAVLFA
jgi:dTDP-4-dehydrorhamnose 3,5-epimerase